MLHSDEQDDGDNRKWGSN